MLFYGGKCSRSVVLILVTASPLITTLRVTQNSGWGSCLVTSRFWHCHVANTSRSRTGASWCSSMGRRWEPTLLPWTTAQEGVSGHCEGWGWGRWGGTRSYSLLHRCCISEVSHPKSSVPDVPPASHLVQCVRASAAPKCSVAWALPWWKCGAQTAAAPTSPVVSPWTGPLWGGKSRGRTGPPLSTCSDSVPPESPEGSHYNHLPPQLHPLSEHTAFPHLFLSRIKGGKKQVPCFINIFHLKSLYCNYLIVNIILLRSTSNPFRQQVGVSIMNASELYIKMLF